MNKKIILIIPARMGSERLKNKNILPINGIPMVVYAAREAKKSKFNPTIFVSSESEKVKKICLNNKLNFIKRPKKLSTRTAEKQEVIVHGSRYISKKYKFKPKIVVSLQCNSPAFDHKDLDKAIKIFNKKFIKKEKKELISVGYDNCQNAAFRIMTYKAVFQRSLSTNIIIFFTNYKDIHTKEEYIKFLRNHG
jgi:CMP-N-acetylneuraminic acid synthetase